MKLELPNVTLWTYNDNNPQLGLKLLLYCASIIEFGEIILITNVDLEVPANVKLIKTERNGYYGGSKCVVFDLHKYVSKDFAMLVHPDGFPINLGKWRPEFLHYDYIGAPWPNFKHRVGNGGFHIRSKRFLEFTSKLDYDIDTQTGLDKAEDYYLCVTLHDYIESQGLKYAPLELAADFSLEAYCADVPRTYADVFGFHGAFNKGGFKTQEYMQRVTGFNYGHGTLAV